MDATGSVSCPVADFVLAVLAEILVFATAVFLVAINIC